MFIVADSNQENADIRLPAINSMQSDSMTAMNKNKRYIIPETIRQEFGLTLRDIPTHMRADEEGGSNIGMDHVSLNKQSVVC